MTVAFTVLGTPAPQGSKRAFINKATGKAGMANSGEGKLNDWRAAVASFAHDGMRAAEALATGGPVPEHATPLDEPVAISIVFYMAKPKSAPKWKIWCDKRPDVDKLLRSTLDGLTGVAFVDDGQVVDVRATMHYAIGRPTGCDVRLRGLGASERESGGYLPFLGSDAA